MPVPEPFEQFTLDLLPEEEVSLRASTVDDRDDDLVLFVTDETSLLDVPVRVARVPAFGDRDVLIESMLPASRSLQHLVYEVLVNGEWKLQELRIKDVAPLRFACPTSPRVYGGNEPLERSRPLAGLRPEVRAPPVIGGSLGSRSPCRSGRASFFVEAGCQVCGLPDQSSLSAVPLASSSAVAGRTAATVQVKTRA